MKIKLHKYKTPITFLLIEKKKNFKSNINFNIKF